jgi:dienelactone hydrolase
MTRKLIAIALSAYMLTSSTSARAAAPAGKELPPADKLPAVTQLPDPFTFSDGTRVRSKEDWVRRRAELEAMILHYQYGQLPPAPGNTTAVERLASGYKQLPATHRVFKVTCGPDKKVSFTLDLLVPKGKGPFPVVLRGDLGWAKLDDAIADEVVKRGYILAEFDRTELAPDNKSYKETGVYTAYPDAECGAVAAWAWGFHRCVDVLATLDFVDKDKIAVTGHSRGGKAAILAGATDTRIALTVPNNSGCGGAGSYKFQAPKSEDIVAITRNFPFWFGPRFTQFIEARQETKDGKEQTVKVSHIDRLPFDQHALKALCAPRAFLQTEALGDLWANPEGSRQTYQAAKEVYKFLGAPDKIAIVYREGKHEHNADDWRVLLDFADQTFFGKKSDRSFDANPFPQTTKTFTWTTPAGQ